jgi:hypothetical protein
VPQAPQFVPLVVRSTQVPAQSVRPVGQPEHWPATHAAPPVQAVPQAPQFCESVCRFTQLRPHITVPVAH